MKEIKTPSGQTVYQAMSVETSRGLRYCLHCNVLMDQGTVCVKVAGGRSICKKCFIKMSIDILGHPFIDVLKEDLSTELMADAL